ncbi:hypothetical protein CARUB_v10025753mg [Capsella rubella]|uniref:ADP-ribosyl cyclase/cyclic ADP-ribose hydrolase n=1 Tax=Capsella rubella TaxID=81985 RepID=R0EUB0_9BRAS|nr:hypothetical protein CARUB_v10025753mg [Capsella rubella]
MASSSPSCNRRYDVFPSFSGSRISIVIFSNKYASSTWCLNELAEIHHCSKELDQMVIPVFYNVDPSEVRKQTGEFGKVFEETCKGKTDGEKQRWMQALAYVANMAGEDSRNWCDEANMIETIANDVSNKLITPSSDFGDFVGVEAHLERLNSILCLESEEVRMLGIIGPSGIGKTTIGRALFSSLSSQFHHCGFVSYKRTSRDDYGMKLCWEQQFLSEILCQKDLKIWHLGAVEQRLKHKKVLIVLDDVDDHEIVKTLVGHTGWFGFGSRIIVITQDKQLLKAHSIDLIYEVEFPSKDLALRMFCRSAFGENSPPSDFMTLAGKVAILAGNLPLGLTVLGSSLRGKDKFEWMEMLPRLQNGLDGKIEKTLRISYDELDGKDQDLFLYIACLFNGHKVTYIKNLLGESVNIGIKMLADKSLIRITTPHKTVQMHNLLQKLGKEIVRAESIYNPGKRRFLVDAKDIIDVFTDNTGTENVLGIYFNTSEINEPLLIGERSFEGMCNLQFIKFYKDWSRENSAGLYLPRGLVYLPRKLRLVYWDEYPLKCMPSNFRTEFLVKLKMENSKLEKLWEGIQPLRNLKKLRLDGSKKLKEIPNLSNAINLEKLNLCGCTSLVTLPSSIRNLGKLRKLTMEGCTKLEALPNDVILGSFDYINLSGCSRLRSFPRISRNVSGLVLDGTAIEEEDSVYIGNISGITNLDWSGCQVRCMPSNFNPEYLVGLTMRDSKLEKLWQGIKSLRNLKKMDLSRSENLKEIPNLSKATNLEYLCITGCTSLVILPSSISNLNNLKKLNMRGCTRLEVLPNDVNLESLYHLDLSECSRLRIFPQISIRISLLYLDDTAIEEVPSSIEYLYGLTTLMMRRCKRLKIVSPNLFKLKSLTVVNFSESGVVTELGDASMVATVRLNAQQVNLCGEHFYWPYRILTVCAKNCESLQIISHSFLNLMSSLELHNCFNLDQDMRELIIKSEFNYVILPGREVPAYFMHQAGSSCLHFYLPHIPLSQKIWVFKACILLEPPTDPNDHSGIVGVRWYFRGKSSVHHFNVDVDSCKMDHLVMFHFWLNLREANDPPSEVDYKHVEFKFFHHNYGCSASCITNGAKRCTQTCTLSLERIKGCGVRLLNVSPSPYGAAEICETEYKQQFGEKYNVEKTERSKKRKRITSGTNEEDINLPGQISNTGPTTPHLELSLWEGEASARVSSRSKLMSPSVSSGNFHGDGASLSLSVSPSYLYMEEEALCVDTMITELQDGETPIKNSSSPPKLFNFLR